MTNSPFIFLFLFLIPCSGDFFYLYFMPPVDNLPPDSGVELSFTEKFLRHMRAFEIPEAFGELETSIQQHLQRIHTADESTDRWNKWPSSLKPKKVLSDTEITRAYISYFQRRVESLIRVRGTYLQKELLEELQTVIDSEGKGSSLLTMDENAFRALNERGAYGEEGIPAIGFNRWKDMQEIQGERNRVLFLEGIRDRVNQIVSWQFSQEMLEAMIQSKYAHILDHSNDWNRTSEMLIAA